MRLFVKHLTTIDCSVLDPVRGLVGATWIVDLEISGNLNKQGMVMDFGHVKRRARDAIEAVADHRLLIPTGYADCQLTESGERCEIQFKTIGGDAYEHASPAAAVSPIPAAACDIESISPILEAAALAACPENVSAVSIRLREEEISGANYCYSHGLKHHDGDCQRIAHGHRSRIEIYIDYDRDLKWEQAWADCWRDIYLVSREDIVEENEQTLKTQYRSNQGEFSLSLPRHRCDILEADTTVEHIAEHLCQATAAKNGGAVTVWAYEGVNKGAIAQAHWD